MTREEFINVLKEHDIPFEEIKLDNHPEYDGVYVCKKTEFNLKKTHPRTYKNLFVPYIRVSHFDGSGKWYTRHNGYCCDMRESKVMDIILKEMAS